MSYKLGSRVVVVGTTGSGKTTAARTLAQYLQAPHIELDALYWGPEWTPVPLVQFRESVQATLSAKDWVVDGNYSKVRDLVWSKADTVVWLDYPFHVILGRLIVRTLQRSFSRELLWGRNQESLRKSLFSSDSIFLWALKTYGRRRRQYLQLFSQAEHAHLTLIHLRRPRVAQAWFAELSV